MPTSKLIVHLWPSLIPIDNEETFFTCDRGLHFGDGVFETFSFLDKKVPFIKQHITRIKDALATISIHLPCPTDNITAWINQAIHQCSYHSGTGKLIITRGNWNGSMLSMNSSPHLFLFLKEKNLITHFDKIPQLSLTIASFCRNQNSPIIRIKSLNYLENILAKKEAVTKNFDDVLFLNNKKEITETTTANIFFIKNNSIITPDLNSGLLPGITRSVVLDLANKMGFNSVEKILTLKEIHDCDEIFITNSAIGLNPIKQIDTIWHTKESFPFTKKLFIAYWDLFKNKFRNESI